jgi:hypothetical protein
MAKAVLHSVTGVHAGVAGVSTGKLIKWGWWKQRASDPVPWGKAPLVYRKMIPCTTISGRPSAANVQNYVVLVQDVPDLRSLAT